MSALCSQVILKDKQFKPYTINSFTFKFNFVACNAVSTWLQEIKQTPKNSKRAYDDVPVTEFPDPYLMTREGLKQHFFERFRAKEVGKEFIGHHGVPGLSFPAIHVYDDNHAHLVGACQGHEWCILHLNVAHAGCS